MKEGMERGQRRGWEKSSLKLIVCSIITGALRTLMPEDESIVCLHFYLNNPHCKMEFMKMTVFLSVILTHAMSTTNTMKLNLKCLFFKCFDLSSWMTFLLYSNIFFWCCDKFWNREKATITWITKQKSKSVKCLVDFIKQSVRGWFFLSLLIFLSSKEW